MEPVEVAAAEILFGMLMLIIAFSIVLPQFEEGIPRFEDAVWYFLAEAAPGECPEPGPCRLRFAGFARAVPARLLEVRESGTGRLLLFRLNEGGDYLKIRWIEAETERS